MITLRVYYSQVLDFILLFGMNATPKSNTSETVTSAGQNSKLDLITSIQL